METVDTRDEIRDERSQGLSLGADRQRGAREPSLPAGSSPPPCRWSGSSHCCCARGSTLTSRTTRSTSWSSGSSARSAFLLGYAAGEAANRRGDARVLLLSLAFMATGGFLGLHAIGTPEILFSEEHAGFQVAIPVGLLVSAVFALGLGVRRRPSGDAARS